MEITAEKRKRFKIAEKILKKAMSLEESDSFASTSVHKRAEFGYELVRIVLVPQGRFSEAIEELGNVISHYKLIGETASASEAYHVLSQIYEKIENHEAALEAEELSYYLCSDECGNKNKAIRITRIASKIEKGLKN